LRCEYSRRVFFLTMADDTKRINCIKVCFDDATFIALGRMAAREDGRSLTWFI
jgi:hypothetical protein